MKTIGTVAVILHFISAWQKHHEAAALYLIAAAVAFAAPG